jgi:2-phosphosulfolactate phosphatase
MVFAQSGFDIRCEWGGRGVALLAPVTDVVIIVDVLSFSTAVDVVVGRGALVYPYRFHDDSAAQFAASVGAELALGRGRSRYSLSPPSLLAIPAGARLVLPSPNGSALSLATGTTPTFAGCLRNAQAVADAAMRIGSRIAVIPAGERWPDGSLRPAFEDQIGAGAIISYLSGRVSPEAQAAIAVFEAAKADQAGMLRECGSGRELIERGFDQDVAMAADLNVSECAPLLTEGAYRIGAVALWAGSA